MDRYLYNNFHEAIISDEIFMEIQQEKLKRTSNSGKNTIAMKSIFDEIKKSACHKCNKKLNEAIMGITRKLCFSLFTA